MWLTSYLNTYKSDEFCSVGSVESKASVAVEWQKLKQNNNNELISLRTRRRDIFLTVAVDTIFDFDLQKMKQIWN